jgi:hypothetical protein
MIPFTIRSEWNPVILLGKNNPKILWHNFWLAERLQRRVTFSQGLLAVKPRSQELHCYQGAYYLTFTNQPVYTTGNIFKELYPLADFIDSHDI